MIGDPQLRTPLVRPSSERVSTRWAPKSQTDTPLIESLFAERFGGELKRAIYSPEAHMAFDSTLNTLSRIYNHVTYDACQMTMDQFDLALKQTGFSEISAYFESYPTSLKQLWDSLVSNEFMDFMTFKGVIKRLRLEVLRKIRECQHNAGEVLEMIKFDLEVTHPTNTLHLKTPVVHRGSLSSCVKSCHSVIYSSDERSILAIQENLPPTSSPTNSQSPVPAKRNQRWVYGYALQNPAILQLAVAYELHPLQVEDVLRFSQESIPRVRKFGHNLAIIILPVLRLPVAVNKILIAYQTEKRNQLKMPSPVSQGSMGSEATFRALEGLNTTFNSVGTRVAESITRLMGQSTPDEDEANDYEQAVVDGHRPLGVVVQSANLAVLCVGLKDTLISLVSEWENQTNQPKLHPDLVACIHHPIETPDDAVFGLFSEVADQLKMPNSFVRRSQGDWWHLYSLMDAVMDSIAPVVSAYSVRLNWYTQNIRLPAKKGFTVNWEKYTNFHCELVHTKQEVGPK